MQPPGSKSLTNRALVLAALARGNSAISNVLLADDTRVMLECLRQLGWMVTVDQENNVVQIGGTEGSIPRDAATMFCGNSGTSIRFLVAVCTLGRGRYHFDGIGRMRRRPIGQLVDVLRNLGGRISYVMEEGFPPVEVLGDGLPGGSAKFASGLSSQFLSAILQVSPYARHEVRIDMEDQQTSWPYVAMTMRLMDVFGHTPHVVRDKRDQLRQIIVPPGSYAGTDYRVEPDASNASYFLAVAAIHPGARVKIEGLGKHSLQGDVGFVDLLRKMGAEVELGDDFISIGGTDRLDGIEADLLNMPDMAQTLAVTALFARGDSVLRGLHTLRHKETDRVAAMAAELTRLGAQVTVRDDMMTIQPPSHLRPATIETYNDHRMAMAFAVAGTRAPGIVIREPECVSKTYPAFFDDLRKIGAR